ncbi:MAG: GFA family protein [Proteobacteria bacterium]|nr:GFA family protein [Pseudomonadota bacterium]
MEQTYKGSCHCGNVRFELTTDIDHVRVCDCSICRKRGALIFRVPEESLNILTPFSEMTLYEWGSRTAKDYFCPVCGILPFRKPSMPTHAEIDEGKAPFHGWAVNTRCLDGFDIFDAPERRIYRADVDVGDIVTDVSS